MPFITAYIKDRTATAHVPSIASSSPRALLHPTTRHPPDGLRSIVDNHPPATKDIELVRNQEVPIRSYHQPQRRRLLSSDAPGTEPGAAIAAPLSLSGLTRWVCNRGLASPAPHLNAGAYGACVATPYHRLEVQGMPTRQTPGFAGVPLKLEVLKLDRYGQTIAADSSSSMQVYSAVSETKINDDTVAFVGSIFSVFQGGRAVFSVGVKPSFASISAADSRTELQRPPYLYFKGTDVTTGVVMETDPQKVQLAVENDTVCPPGSVLSLDPRDIGNTFPRAGACKACRPGTYSLDALASPAGTGQDPDCFNCPAGGDCKAGGNIVKFQRGNWTQVDGMHVLKSCPQGFKVINTSSDSNGVFLHDSQSCQVCNKVRTDDYCA